MAKAAPAHQVTVKSPITPIARQTEHIVRNTKGLRTVLFEEMELVRAGKSNPTRANAMSKLAQNVVDTLRVEMEHERHKARLINGNNLDDDSMVVDLGEHEEN